MITFNYKGFSSTYEIKQLEDHLYVAEGEVFRIGTTSIKKFYTEQETSKSAQKKLMNLIENHINFESGQTKN